MLQSVDLTVKAIQILKWLLVNSDPDMIPFSFPNNIIWHAFDSLQQGECNEGSILNAFV